MKARLFKTLARSSGSVTAVHIDGAALRVLEVRRKGNRAEVRQCFTEERTAKDGLQDLGRLLKARSIKGRVVMITDEVRFLASELNLAGAEQVAEEKRLAAAMWEIEPYLDFTLPEGLFACELQTPGNHQGDRVPILVAAMEKERYARYATFLKERGLELTRIYAPEGALAGTTDLPQRGGSRFVIGWSNGSVRGLWLTDQGPMVFQEKPLSEGEEALHRSMTDMLRELTTITGGAEETVLLGSPASGLSFQDPGWGPDRVRMWSAGDLVSLGTDTLESELVPDYAMAAGAALHEVGLSALHLPALTDRVSLKKALLRKIRENPRLVPGIAVGCLVLGLAGHYAYTRASIGLYAARIERLKAEERRLRQPLDEKRRLDSRLTELLERKAYIREVLPESNAGILRLLEALAERIPPDVVLNTVHQEADGGFTIEGNAYSGQSITDFSKALGALDSCEATILESVSRPRGASTGREKLLPYAFRIRMRFTP